MNIHPLAQYRTRKGYSREKVAKDAGTTRQTVYRIEHGEQVPSLTLVGRFVALSGGELSANDFLPLEAAE